MQTKKAVSRITAETRRESHENTDKSGMSQKVLEVFKDKKLTAREAAAEMYEKGYIPYPARAVIQPRITELVESGKLEVVEKKKDIVTDRKVAVYRVKNECL